MPATYALPGVVGDASMVLMRTKSGASAGVTFSIDMTMPEEPGSHRIVLQMLHSGLWLFGEKIELVVKVVAEDD